MKIQRLTCQLGIASTFRLLGGAIAQGIYSAVIANKFSAQITERTAKIAAANNLSAQALLSAARTNTAAAYAKVPGINPSIQSMATLAVKLSYVQAFRLVFLIAIAFGVSAIIAAACTRSTNVATKNNDRAVVLKNEMEVSETK
jgi:hypothetical protein